MKKKRKILLAAILILAITIPAIVYAQMVKQAECCRLSQNIAMNDVTWGTPAAACSFHPNVTTFSKGDVVGMGDCAAGLPNTCKLKGEVPDPDIDIESHEWGTICLLNSVYNLTNWVFFFFLAIAIFIGVLAGYQFMTAAGDPGKVTKARDLLLYMAIGLIIAAVAKIIPTLIRTVVGF